MFLSCWKNAARTNRWSSASSWWVPSSAVWLLEGTQHKRRSANRGERAAERPVHSRDELSGQHWREKCLQLSRVGERFASLAAFSSELERLLLNIGGPRRASRCMLASATTNILLYGTRISAPLIWKLCPSTYSRVVYEGSIVYSKEPAAIRQWIQPQSMYWVGQLSLNC